MHHRRIHFGIESGNEQVLRLIRKGVDLQRAREVLTWCRAIGIETHAYFMVGFPGEGHAEAQDTIRYALALDCDYVHVAVTTPFPGTELYRLGLETGVFKQDYWRDFARNPTADFVPAVWEDKLTREQMIGYMMTLYRKFYMRPRVLARHFSRLRSLREFRAKAGAGFRLLLRTLRRSPPNASVRGAIPPDPGACE